MSTPDWFLLIAVLILAAGLALSVAAFRRWLDDHERVEFSRADAHHLESKEKLDAHEDRAVAREERAIERHTHTIKMMQANEAITRQAVQQRIRIEDELVAIKAKLGTIDQRLQALEGGGST